MILAVPVAPEDSLRALRALCQEVVCLAAPYPFYAVGTHDADFTQASDEEFVELLADPALFSATHSV